MRIMIFSGKARHGKDAAAEFALQVLGRNGKRAVQIAYSDYISFIATKYFGWNGERDEAGRTLLQDIGKSFREKDAEFWVRSIADFLRVTDEKFDYALLTGARYPNDLSYFVERFDVVTVRVDRPDFDNGLTDEQKAHISETALDDYPFTHRISNAGTLEDLHVSVIKLLEGLD